ncbi:MAG: VWA domain-containing protein [Phycisphaeraceae bacterium]|nr:VWA domain-containing protein [Phycisphaeraceae bacterium]
MVITPLVALWIAIAVAVLVLLAELLHQRRIRRIAHLAFGPDGRPAAWTSIASPLRVFAAAAATWGLLVLASADPAVREETPTREASRHLLIALDVSPSMQLVDAGPDAEKESRAIRAGRIVQGVLDRLDASTTRVSLVAFYTDALPVLTETFDKEVVRNALDGLPMSTAFESGATKITEGVTKSLETARSWMPGTATLLVVSDGDELTSTAVPALPASIADVLVVGVGDPQQTMSVGGHASRQDTVSLKQLAARLGGVYHQGNTRHPPSRLLEDLTMIEPRLSDADGLRELAIYSSVAGVAALALLGPLLSIAGRPRSWSRGWRGTEELS